jgi:DNA recombination protein RmuC
MELVFFLLGLVAGGIILWMFHRFSTQSKTDLLNNKLQMLNDELASSREQITKKDKELFELHGILSARNSDYHHLQEKLENQKKEVNSLHDKFSIEFKNLANEILEEKSKKFTEQNKSNLSEVLKPLSEKIKDFEKKVEETYDKEAQQRFSLKEEVKRLAELNQQVSKEAQNLAKALKGDSKTQGNWGEVILESILERSGLVKNREYFIQPSYTNDTGKRFQPDVVVTYPGDRSIVIDSKVSLVAYEKFVTSDTREEKDKALKEHLQSIKTHTLNLSGKNYQDLYELSGLDFVMLFMPVEPAYYLAIQQDAELWNYAYDRRILLISPTNLIAALKMIESMWRQEYQSQNAQLIARKSGDLYDKFVGLVEDLIDVGNKLRTTQNAYESSMKKLSEGKGNLIKRSREIKDLGLKTKKDLPKGLLERSEKEE